MNEGILFSFFIVPANQTAAQVVQTVQVVNQTAALVVGAVQVVNQTAALVVQTVQVVNVVHILKAVQYFERTGFREGKSADEAADLPRTEYIESMNEWSEWTEKRLRCLEKHRSL